VISKGRGTQAMFHTRVCEEISFAANGAARRNRLAKFVASTEDHNPSKAKPNRSPACFD